MCGQTIGRRDGMQATLFRFFRICRRGQCAEEVLPQRRVSYPQPLLAPALPGEQEPKEVEDMIRGAAGELLQRIDLFDRFEKNGKVSLAFRLVFQSFDRTLTDEDANQRMESVYGALKSRGFEIR